MNKLIGMLVSLVVIFAIALAAYEAYLKKPDANVLAEPIVIGQGMKTSEIADLLKKSGVISSAALFTVITDVTGSFKDFHAGTFVLKNGMSVADVISTLSYKGKEEISVVIPEGFSLRQIASRLVSAGVLKTEAEFFAVTGTPAQSTKIEAALVKDYSFLSDLPASASLEGYLFPDTYRFYPGTTADQVVRKMLENYNAKTSSLKPTLTREDLIVASLVEEEVKGAADQAKVADIIRRRLFAGMPLGFDSTVNYVTGKNNTSVTLKDLAIDSPWNTYKHVGLPPTPIDNPGLSAIAAALAPTPNKYLYFLTKPDGTVVYSKTLAEHNTAKEKYLK